MRKKCRQWKQSFRIQRDIFDQVIVWFEGRNRVEHHTVEGQDDDHLIVAQYLFDVTLLKQSSNR